MQNQKTKEKLTITTKGMQLKKSNLDINTNNPIESGIKSMPTGFPTFQEDPLASHYKSASTVTTPSNKNLKQMTQIPENDEVIKKKNETGKDLRKGNNKETTLTKVEVPSKTSTNQVTSPKAALNKEKLLISYGSEKNLGSIKPVEKKQTPRSKQNRIEQIQN